MQISLNSMFNEVYKSSSELQSRLEGIYPIVCNLNFSGIHEASLHLNGQEQILHSYPSERPQFTLHLDPQTFWKLLKEKTIPSKKIEGDSELALMFLIVLAESNVDIEVLIYNHFGTVPGLLMRRLLSQEYLDEQNKTGDIQVLSLQQELRNIAIRIDRLEQTVVL